MKTILQLTTSILICQGAGLIGAIFTSPGVKGWYTTLIRPSFAPPNWIFGPVWTLLFTLMGIALFLLWRMDFKGAKLALLFFIIQFAFNIFWSVLFFGFHSPLWAFIEIIILLIFIILTIVYFWKANTWAGVLLLPYLLWVSFAMVLNFGYWWLNK